ncbi:PAS domain-containing hybrid sensor histidine kinase/response regulator [Desulforhopalus sp. 52FAK]
MEQAKGVPRTSFAELRRRAQAYLSASPSDAEVLSQEDVIKLVHELDTYQVELELQNEDLIQAQRELEQSRHRFSDLYDFAPVGYLTISDKGAVIDANLTAADMLGVPRGDLFLLSLSSFIYEPDQDIYYLSRKKLLDTREPQTCIVRIRKGDDNQFYAHLRAVVDPDIDDEEGQFRVTLTDISEQKELELALLRSKEEWVQTFDAIADMVIIQDSNMCILKANKAVGLSFGLDYQQIVGKKCFELFHGSPDYCPDCPTLQTLKEMAIHTHTIFHKELDKFFMVTSSLAPFSAKDSLCCVHVAKDITEQKKNDKLIQQAQKMESIGTLAGGIAHEFNNLLMIMLGSNEFIIEELPPSGLCRESAEEVKIAGLRARDVVKQLLTFSRQDNSTTKVIDLGYVVEESMQLIRASTPANIAIEQSLSADTYPIMGNETQITQIIINLCKNSADALPAQEGLITIELLNETIDKEQIRHQKRLKAGDYAKLIVSDNGIGINNDLLSKVFEPYVTTKEIGKGTGIGLAVVHGIVESHRGTILVDSNPGQGTTFTILIPAYKGPLEEEIDEQDDLPTGEECILYIDDEAPIAHVGKRNLDSLGYRTEATTDPLKAVEMVKSDPYRFDLIITDMAMPNMTGDQLIDEILKIRQDMPIIVCTGYRTENLDNKAKDFRGCSFVMKPLAKSDLAIKVRNVLDNAQ